MSTREELQVLAKQLDKIITSERPEIKEAFRELSIMSTLIADNNIPGPLEVMIQDITRLQTEHRETQRRMSRIENNYHESYGKYERDRRYYDTRYRPSFTDDIHMEKMKEMMFDNNRLDPFKPKDK